MLPPNRAEPEELTLPLPRGGVLSVAATTSPQAGTVRYAVHTRHLRGVFVVRPHAVAGELLPAGVRVNFGDGEAPVRPYRPRPDEPVVHRVRVHGTATCTAPDRLPDPRAVLVEAVVLGENHATRRVPDRAAALLEDTVLAVLQHWRIRDDRNDLVQAVARLAAPTAVRATRTALATAEADLHTVRERLRLHQDRLLRLKELAAAPPPPPNAPAGVTRLVYTDEHGQALGTALVRESAVNEPPGTVTYRVDGPRLSAGVVIGPYLHSDDPVPTGISVQYGTGGDEPVVNGIRLRGGWNHDSTTPITPSSPATLPRPSRADAATRPVPAATYRRWWAVVRALAAHYTQRPDITLLRLAAAHARAADRRHAEQQTLAELQTELDKLTHTAAALRRRLNDATALMN
ncbi:hypothetical protein OG393_33835 (plasmid) [Streptomyces sp. NBC_01216]|uniref:hypothetical protein n=1 Tax=Streptomyces sp. NBC_01216 TaxID=2903778 RepID=UPI002E11663F|nr:hypothetical protein OG393_33835 [Streptomyces sp. NBC_01216]